MINICARISKYQIHINSIQEYVKKYWNIEIVKVVLVNKTEKDETYLIGFKDFEMYVFDHTKEECWNSSLLNTVFEEKQVISIAIHKNNASKERIYSIVKLFMCISKASLTDMLITSEIHNDICFVGAYSKTGCKWDDSFYEQYKDLISE